VNDLLALAVELASEGAELALRLRRAGLEVDTKSSPVDVVTNADRAVEAHIRARLAAIRPEDGFLGEESDAAGSVSGLTWVVDPIDGTVNFLYGIPEWACSVAVVEGGDPASWTVHAGAVVNAAADERYAAALGGGATRNGDPIRTGAPTGLAMSLLATGFGYRAETRAEQGRSVQVLLPRVRDIRRHGAASLELCSVASGRLDAYAERGLSPWDFAAGALIAAEAGAVVTAGDVREGRRLVTAAAPTIAAELAAALVEAGL